MLKRLLLKLHIIINHLFRANRVHRDQKKALLRSILIIENVLGKHAAGTYHASRTIVQFVIRPIIIVKPILSINLEWKRGCVCGGIREAWTNFKHGKKNPIFKYIYLKIGVTILSSHRVWALYVH